MASASFVWPNFETRLLNLMTSKKVPPQYRFCTKTMLLIRLSGNFIIFFELAVVTIAILTSIFCLSSSCIFFLVSQNSVARTWRSPIKWWICCLNRLLKIGKIRWYIFCSSEVQIHDNWIATFSYSGTLLIIVFFQFFNTASTPHFFFANGIYLNVHKLKNLKKVNILQIWNNVRFDRFSSELD